jgi:hypothetical protein
MKEQSTTIKLNKKTKTRLDALKTHKRETYDDVLQNILSILNKLRANPFQARTRLDEIDKLRRQIKGSS